MKIADIAVRRPVTILMIVLICLVLGSIAFSRLTIDLLPDIELPIAVVITDYEGAGPHEVETMISRPLEEVMQTVGRINSVTSISAEGQSLVIAEFNWGTDMDIAMLEMRERIDRIRGILPDDAETPMVMGFDPTQMPIMEYGITGDMDLAMLRQIVEDDIVPSLERVDGVASIDVHGGLVREIQVILDPGKLRAYEISTSDINQAIRASNLNIPGGDITIEDRRQLLLRTMGEFTSIDDIGDVMVPGRQGAYYLRDIADIVDGYQDVTQYTRVDGRDSVGISIQKEAEANTVQVAQSVSEALEDVQSRLTEELFISTISDQSSFINMSISNVRNNAIIGGVFAILVLFSFLGNITTTIIIAVAIPISIITTFVLIYFTGMTLNIMSLGGLALGIGMLVDNAIVVLENIYRHRNEGATSKDASVIGTGEVGTAIAASTLTTLMVFLPVVFIEGIAAQIFRDLSFTVTFALLTSLLVSVSLIPMLCSRLLRIKRNNKKEPFVGRFLNKISGIYRIILGRVLSARLIVVMVAGALLAVSITTLSMIGTEFLPPMDEGQIRVTVEMPRGTPLNRTNEVVTYLEDRLFKIPEVKTIQGRVGTGGGLLPGGGGSDEGRITVQLVPLRDRQRSTEEVMEELRHIAENIMGADISVSPISTLMGGGAMGDAPVQVDLRGADLEELEALSNEVADILRGISGTREISTSIEEQRYEMQVQINRRKAASYGLTTAQVGSAIRTAISGQVVTRYRAGGEEIDILVRLKDVRDNIEAIKRLPLSTPGGTIIPLSEIAELVEGMSPIEITRINQARAVSVYAQLYDVDLGTVTDVISRELDRMDIPAGVVYSFGGETEWMEDAFDDLYVSLIMAIILVYMILAAQFESLWQPFVILFSVPFAFVGVAWALVVTGRTINVASLIGLIMLVGIVVNNAIVFLDYVNQLIRRGISRLEALLIGGEIRLRPILMTTSTTMLALLPLAMGIGEGAELQAPIATVVIGGLLVSTAVTLVIVPVMYTIFDDTIKFFRMRNTAKNDRVDKGADNLST